jgi:hypothetical protein
VPQRLQTRYTQAITRAEFAALSVTLYEKLMKPIVPERNHFNDTTDVNVNKAADIGVVIGVGEGMFAPNDTLTREQAATMLSRLAAALEKPIPEAEPTFVDNNRISYWAFDAVGQIQAAGIMQGIGGNIFSPQDPYTIEQSITTMLRMHNYVVN